MCAQHERAPPRLQLGTTGHRPAMPLVVGGRRRRRRLGGPSASGLRTARALAACFGCCFFMNCAALSKSFAAQAPRRSSDRLHHGGRATAALAPSGQSSTPVRLLLRGARALSPSTAPRRAGLPGLAEELAEAAGKLGESLSSAATAAGVGFEGAEFAAVAAMGPESMIAAALAVVAGATALINGATTADNAKAGGRAPGQKTMVVQLVAMIREPPATSTVRLGKQIDILEKALERASSMNIDATLLGAVRQHLANLKDESTGDACTTAKKLRDLLLDEK
mmetsp:Transcript_44104/g.141404  ORF Transcript_44104/g.141404 Transcript_44104/m.141404 type:complete len:280 (+) Transcript_44104:96-935(+)